MIFMRHTIKSIVEQALSSLQSVILQDKIVHTYTVYVICSQFAKKFQNIF